MARPRSVLITRIRIANRRRTTACLAPLLALGLLCGGCGGTSSSEEAADREAPTCKRAWANVLELIEKDPEMSAQFAAVEPEQQRRGSQAVLDECEATWSPAVRACYAGAKNNGDLGHCEDLLTPLTASSERQ